jgi:hypothetical protein
MPGLEGVQKALNTYEVPPGHQIVGTNPCQQPEISILSEMIFWGSLSLVNCHSRQGGWNNHGAGLLSFLD